MAVRMRKVLAESDHARMDSLFPTRQRINGQLVYSANKLLGREVQTRYTRAATSLRLELQKKRIYTSIELEYFCSLVFRRGSIVSLFSYPIL